MNALKPFKTVLFCAVACALVLAWVLAPEHKGKAMYHPDSAPFTKTVPVRKALHMTRADVWIALKPGEHRLAHLDDGIWTVDKDGEKVRKIPAVAPIWRQDGLDTMVLVRNVYIKR